MKLRTYIRYELLGKVWPPPPTPFEHLRNLPRYQPVTVDLKGLPFTAHDPLMLYGQYREIFQQEVYRFEGAGPEPVIIDCGANCGMSIAYFKETMPGARITGVEADPAIFEVLKRNVEQRRLSGVTLVNKAVSDTREPLVFHTEGSDAGRLHAATGGSTVEVPGVLFDDLIEGRVDFLKMDIEGAETEALAACTKLGQVNRLFVEYHSFSDRPQQLDRLLATLSRAGFRYYIKPMFCPRQPLVRREDYLGMDLQLNVYGVRT